MNNKHMGNNQRLGIICAIAATIVFALQDGMSKHLVTHYNVFFVVMLRYWGFAVFIMILCLRQSGGIKAVAQSAVLPVQIFRGVLLALQICLMIWSFAQIGIINTHVIFVCFPLLVTALSVVLLSEKVGIHRWGAVVIGLMGVFIIIRPDQADFSPLLLIPLCGTLMFALYQILTRWVSKADSPNTSFFWTGIGGVLVLTCIGPFFWDPMDNAMDWFWMIALIVMGTLGHYLMIRALALAEASSIQPFFFLHLVFASTLAMLIFGESFTPAMLLGSFIIIASALYTFWRERTRQTRVKHTSA